MPDAFSLGRFIADRRIGTKIGAGFAAVLLILAISSTMAWLAFNQVSEAMNRYGFLVANSSIFRDIDLAVANYRGLAREYIYSNDEATADLAVKDAEAVAKAEGLAGAQIGGDVSYPPEPWTISYENLTVRQALNRLVHHMGEQGSWAFTGSADFRAFAFNKQGFLFDSYN